MKKNLTAVILCGGKGSRLGNIKKTNPKPLVKVQSKPIIWYIIKKLERSSISQVILPLGFRGNKIRKYINSEFKNSNLQIDLFNTGVNSTISERIYFIQNYIKSDDFILLNGDTIFDINISRIIKDHFLKKKSISMLACSPIYDYGIIFNEKDKVTSFKRNVKVREMIALTNNNINKGLIYSGMSIIKTNLLNKINFRKSKNFEEFFFNFLIKKNKVTFLKVVGFWFSIDLPYQLAIANKSLEDFRFKKIQKLKERFINER